MRDGPTTNTDQILVDAKQASAMLAISERTLWQHSNTGAIPRVRVGRAVRYRPSDLHAWVDAGCPSKPEGRR